MGLPNRHAIQNQQSGWKPPVCGYSSFHVQGSKFAHAGGPPTSRNTDASIVYWDRDTATGALTNQVNLIDSTNLDGVTNLKVSPDGEERLRCG